MQCAYSTLDACFMCYDNRLCEMMSCKKLHINENKRQHVKTYYDT